MLSGFRAFILRGNLVDLAVAFVLGASFAALVTAFVKDLITPIIGALGGNPNFSGLSFKINHSTFLYGDFINFLLTFLIIAAVMYFLVVVPYNRFRERFMPEMPPAPTKECPHCISSIPESATRCAFCTADLAPATG